jgi:hypothetical protein
MGGRHIGKADIRRAKGRKAKEREVNCTKYRIRIGIGIGIGKTSGQPLGEQPRERASYR